MTKGQDWLQSKFLPPADGSASAEENATVLFPVREMEAVLRLSYPRDTKISTPDLLRFYATAIDRRPDESRIEDPYFDKLSDALISLSGKIEKSNKDDLNILITNSEWTALQTAPSCFLSLSTLYNMAHMDREREGTQIKEELHSSEPLDDNDERRYMAALLDDWERTGNLMEELFDGMFHITEKTEKMNRKPTGFGYDSPNGFD